jgi:benzil reductase ((S)-benzoin forming)
MVIITGVSRGFGKALAQHYLAMGEKVVGIGRSATIQHPNFSFLYCDLSDLNAIDALSIELFDEQVTLINNAGILGDIRRLSDKVVSDLDTVMNVNVSAPTRLMLKIYGQMSDKNAFTLVNISSGAANRAIPSWAAYCASKAALNMITETFALEELEKGNAPKVYAVAPGVIDTDMQAHIRGTDTAHFSAVANFQRMKNEGELFSPDEAAKRLVLLLAKQYDDTIFHDLRTISIE